jgi:N-acetylmuramic acid 6-phosphate (MurNAc-6-P) etherase
VLMGLADIDAVTARARLEAAGGYLRAALDG